MSDAPVILLHAGICDRRMWDRVVPSLHDAGRKVVTPDLRGFGSRPLGLGPFTHSGDVLALLDGLGIDSADVVGASFGGGVALQLAARAPGRVSSLTLLAPALPGWEDWSDPALLEYASAEEAAFNRGDTDAVVDLSVGFWAGELDRADREYVAEAQRRAIELGGEGAEEEEQPFDLAAITAPTLVLVGDRDTTDFMRIGEHLSATLATAQLQVVEGAGHLLALERPEVISEVLAGRLAAR